MSKEIFQKVYESPEVLLNHYDIYDFEDYHDRITFACPIHGGDSIDSLVVYKNDGDAPLIWNCFSNNCQELYNKTLFGLVQGLEDCVKDSEINYRQFLKLMERLYGVKAKSSYNKTPENRLISNFFVESEQVQVDNKVDRSKIRSRLKIPSDYFSGRGFSKELLNKLDVGDCYNKGTEMYCRAVVPVYDIKNNYVGCVGRRIYENDEYQKWRESKGFQSGKTFYNINNAIESIKHYNVIILVEGQGDVWALNQAGINNVVGLFGDCIKEGQIKLLNSIGITDVIILTDFDEPGIEGFKRISEKLYTGYNIYRPTLSRKDAGECSGEELYRTIKEYKMVKV